METERTGAGAEPPDAALRRLARLSRLPMIQLRWPWRSAGALAAFHVASVATLWAGGFPRARLAAVAACWVVQSAATLRFVLRGAGPTELGLYPPGALRLGILHLVTGGVAVALTGGLASPLVVTLLMGPVTSLALFGAARESRLFVGATAVGLVVLGAVPDAWAGPALPAAVVGALAALSLLTAFAVVGTSVLRLRRALRDCAREIGRVREELASQALARARGLEEVGSQVAHELKNPLAAVKALAQLGSGDAAGPAGREAFAAIDREVGRMQVVLAEYLSFARPVEELRPERVELGELAEGVLEILSARAHRAGVRALRRGTAAAFADRRRLEEALLNLVANAIEATPPGGSVELEVGARDGQARVVVRDTGRGMPPEVLARAGTPFFTTRETGSGLGLVLARSVLEQHGGALRLESAPGRGTTATATLPVEPRPEKVRRDEPAPDSAVRLRIPWVNVAVTTAFQALAIGAVWAGGLSPARIGAFVGACAAKLVVTGNYAARPAAPHDASVYPPSALLLGLVHVVGGAIWMGVSGGLSSPFLVTQLPPGVVSLATFGPVWQTWVVIGTTAASLAVLAFLPEAVTGPALAGVPGAVVVATAGLASMLIAGANFVRGREVLSASARALAHARDALASHAVARARSLEAVGARVARELEGPLAEVGRIARDGAAAADDARAREWFQVIRREVARMQGILAEYLAFARPLQSYRPEPVALGPLVADVLAVLSGRAAHAGVSEAAHGDAAVTGDPRRLREALLNLVANAIDATPEGGRVDVQVGGDDGQARIVIRDTGRGMAPDVLARVGTPFFTTRAAGTGLGVVLARSVFHRHGGGLRYESAPGRGTTVTATLPLHPGGAGGPRPGPPRRERREEARYGDRAVGR